jgi:adenylate cyclase
MWRKLNLNLDQLKTKQIVIIVNFIVIFMVIGCNQIGLFQSLELIGLDYFFRLRPVEKKDPRIVIVGITEKDIQKLGHYPITDHDLVQLLTKIKAQKPRIIGLDLVRDLPVDPGHQDLINLFETMPNLIGVQKVLGNKINAPPLLEEKGQVGISDVITDMDGKVRRGLISANVDETLYLSLGTILALLYLEKEGINLEMVDEERKIYRLGKTLFSPFKKNDGGYINGDDRGYQILLNYRGGACQNENNNHNCPFYVISLTDILEDKIPANLMSDRLVLIGIFAESVNDIFYTPYTVNDWTVFSGVEIHANLASQIISEGIDGRKKINFIPQFLELIWLMIWTFLGGLSAVVIIKKPWYIIFNFLLICTLFLISYYLFILSWWLPVASPLIGLITNTIITLITILAYQLRQSYLRLEEKVALRTKELHIAYQKNEELIASILPYQIAQKLKQQKRVIAEHFDEVTILFADIVGFTPLSSRLPPQDLVYLLNQIFTEFDQVTEKYGLEKIKTIGDAYMVAGGLPIPKADHAIAIANMALEMQEIIKNFETTLNETINIRIGINTGAVVAGVIGLKKFSYDLWGDAVNIASRMESSGIEGKIQVTSYTYEYLKEKFILEKRGLIKVKGKGEMLTYWLIEKK